MLEEPPLRLFCILMQMERPLVEEGQRRWRGKCWSWSDKRLEKRSQRWDFRIIYPSWLFDWYSSSIHSVEAADFSITNHLWMNMLIPLLTRNNIQSKKVICSRTALETYSWISALPQNNKTATHSNAPSLLFLEESKLNWINNNYPLELPHLLTRTHHSSIGNRLPCVLDWRFIQLNKNGSFSETKNTKNENKLVRFLKVIGNWIIIDHQ